MWKWTSSSVAYLQIKDSKDALEKLFLLEDYAERIKSTEITKHILELRAITGKQTGAGLKQKK